MVRNIIRIFFSNAVSFVISALITFLIPRRLDIASYGYFQLYLFYVSYTGFAHFGWADGVFLRYGGAYYEDLDRKKFSGQFWLYSAFELILGTLVALAGWKLAPEAHKGLVIVLTAAALILVLPRTLLQFILQATDRMRECAVLTIAEKVIFLLAVSLVLILRLDSYAMVIFCDLLSKAAALSYVIFQCRDLVFSRPNGLKPSLQEAFLNISVGIKLMFANIASLLIIGIVRMAIEQQWDVETFAKISLTMSVSNMLMLFIRAIAFVMFPMLCRTSPDQYSRFYSIMRSGLMVPLLGMLIFYYPVKTLLVLWLPKYADGLRYMAILFPMCVFESKMSMLIETYIKAMRREKWLLMVNSVTVILSLILTGITVYGLKSLDLAVLSIILLLCFRCIYAERLLASVMDIQVRGDTMMELAVTAVFISVNWFLDSWWGLFIYLGVYGLYLLYKREDVKKIWGYGRQWLKKIR